MSEPFSVWLSKTLPPDICYADAANLCASLFCVVDAIPDHLRPAVRDKQILAEAFAALVRDSHFEANYGELMWSYYGASFHDPRDRGHWLEVMASVLKLARQPDHERATYILQLHSTASLRH